MDATTDPTIDARDTISADEIPLPSQIPRTLDIKALPTSILRSGAVEALLGQNDDLMARLSVSLRRIVFLENELKKAEDDNGRLQRNEEIWRDQVLILKAKMKSIDDRQRRDDDEFQQLKKEIELREIQFAELYSTSKERQRDLSQQVERLTRKLGRYYRYHRRIREALSAYKGKILTHWRHEVAERDQEIQKLRQEAIDASRLRKDLADAAEYIKSQSQEHRQNQELLVSGYEKRVAEAQRKAQELEERYLEARDKADLVPSLFQDKVELENQIVILQRQLADQRGIADKDLAEVQRLLSQYRDEAATKTEELIATSQEKEKWRELAESRNRENQVMAEQLSAIQNLWRDQQLDFEREIEKNKSLQSLNHQLSIRLNAAKKDVRQLQEKLDSQRLSPERPPESMNRIEQLMAEIQTSFNLPGAPVSPENPPDHPLRKEPPDNPA